MDFSGFIGPSYTANSRTQDASETINMFLEVDPTKKQGEVGGTALYPMPGLHKIGTAPNNAPIRAMRVMPGSQKLLVVAGNKLYQVTSPGFTPVEKGTFNTALGNISITDNGISAYFADGATRYSYNLASESFTAIPSTDGGFQGGNTCDYIDTFIIYNRPGSNQWGSTNPLSVDSQNLSFSSKDSTSDNIVTLIADHREAVLIGEFTTERWSNAGTFPFPFQRIPGSSLQYGCAALQSVARIGDSIAWLSQNTRGQLIVLKSVGYQAQRISTHAIENDILGGVVSDAIAFTYQMRGHEFYVLAFPTQDKTWVYDFTTEMWTKWAWRDAYGTLHRHRANCAVAWSGNNLVGDWENGNIYELSQTTYTDDGAPILRMRRSTHITQSLHRVFYHAIQVHFEPGVGNQLDPGSNATVTLRTSNDGGFTWSGYREQSLGRIGQYKNRAIWRKLGFARDMVFEVSTTDPVKFVIVNAELDIEEGEH